MKIGVISKLEHCAPHVEALRRLGHKPILLGSDTTDIPDSVDLVVLRTQSCSHGASGVAWDWSRRTGGKLLVENGKTSMIRKVQEIFPNFLQAAFLAGDSDILADNLHTSPPQEPEKVTVMPSTNDPKLPAKLINKTPPPAGATFAVNYRYAGLHASCVLAAKYHESLSFSQIEAFEKLFEYYDEFFSRKDRFGEAPTKPASLSTLFDYLKGYEGNPRDFLTFCFYFGLNGRKFNPYKRTLAEIYYQISGSKVDYLLTNCVSWIFDIPLRDAPKQLPARVEKDRYVESAPVKASPAPVKASPAPVKVSQTPVTENEDLKKKLESAETTILELMMSMDALSQRVANLEGKVEASPAAQPVLPNPAPASNPFQVLEEVKAMLAAAGFRGELVLKIG